MTIVYNFELDGFQIIYTPNRFTNRAIWNKPVNDIIYETWEEASHDIDRWAE